MIDSDQLETQANTKQSLSNGGNKEAKNLLMKDLAVTVSVYFALKFEI